MLKQLSNSKLHGIIQIILSGYWTYLTIDRIINQVIYEHIYIVMIPNWTLALDTITGLIGIYIGIRTFASSINVMKSYLLWIGMYLLVIGVEILIYNA